MQGDMNYLPAPQTNLLMPFKSKENVLNNPKVISETVKRAI